MDIRPKRFDTAIEYLLYALLAFMPLAFGAVHAWSQQVVILLSALMAACFLAKLLIVRAAAVTFSWALVPLILFCLIPVLQLAELPVSLVETLSPNTAAIKKDLLGMLPGGQRRLGTMTLSFYPWITASQFRLVVAVATIFVVVLNVFRTPEQIKRLLTAISVIGGTVTILALLQVMTQTDKIYWIVPIPHKLANSGPFVNHSHYGQFMNLSIGAALGLLFVKLHEAFTRRQFSIAVAADFFESRTGKRIWFLLAMIIIGAASVFVALTRGGIVSMLIAAGFTTLLVTSRQSIRGRGWIMVLMALAAFMCVLYIGFDAVYDRLATLGDLEDAQGGRLQILKDIALAWTKFPVFGTGLGTHEVVYPMFNRSTIAALAAHAENEYAQTAEELGLAGILPLLVFGAFVWFDFAKCIRTAQVPIRSAAYGLGFGLLAILIHSFSDFGQHLPANAALSAVFCALLIALSRMDAASAGPARAAKPLSRRVILWTTGVLAAVGCFNVLQSNEARIAESHWNKARAVESDLAARQWQAQADYREFVSLIRNALSAADSQPGSVHYRHWLNVYRWRSMTTVPNPESGLPTLPPESLKTLDRIIDEFYGAIPLAPTFGPTWCVVGQLTRLRHDLVARTQAADQGPDHLGAALIRKGLSLAPCDPTVCLVAGLLDIEEALASAGPDPADPNATPFLRDSPQLQAAESRLSRAVELDSRLFRDVVDVYVRQIGRPDLAIKLAAAEVWRLSYVANVLAEQDKESELAQNVRIQITTLLENICADPQTVSPSALASLAGIYTRQDRTPDAIEHYRKALVLDYGQVAWRMQLARLLASEKQYDQAIHEARICLRLKPGYAPATKLIQDLSVKPAEN
ncbi:MAG: O-antigen ligase family protein [Phycisphaerae bacterium]|nr:O-antigen ligase family protein [Phycisphaerae bacterium]